MSYRDLRNLCEILRAVGYPRLVSIENFRNPNFPLVADIGRWLVQQYEPKADIPSSCDTETERVALIRAFAEFMLVNVQVRLNTKRLYQADGYAVKELLKVASVLYDAVREAEMSQTGARGPSSKSSVDPERSRIDVKELRETRSLTSQLVQKGVSLYDMLSKEGSLREARHQALSKAYEHAEVERLIKLAMEAGSQEAKKMGNIIDTVQNNVATIDSKIEKKQSELERSQKRLQTLKKVRPAFMDEYEELQKDLALEYQNYVNRFRCLAHITQQIEDMDRLEQERKMEERLIKAEHSRRAGGDDLLPYGNGKGNFILNSSGSEESDEEDLSMGGMNGKQIVQQNPSRAGGGRAGSNSRIGMGATTSNNPIKEEPIMTNGGGGGRKTGRKPYGNMLGPTESDDESEMILIDGENDNSELVSDDDDELLALHKEQLAEDNGTKNNFKSGRIAGRHRLSGQPSKESLHNDDHQNGNVIYDPMMTNNGDAVNGGSKGYQETPRTTRSTMSRPSSAGRQVPAAPPSRPSANDDDEF